MIPNTSPQKFLEEHLGLTWTPVSYDETEYGMLGEDIAIQPAHSIHKPNGYQSDALSDELATKICNRLAELGITNPADFTRIGIGNSAETQGLHSDMTFHNGQSIQHTAWQNNGATEAVTLLFKAEAIERLMQNAALIDATIETPLITDSGLNKKISPEGWHSYTEKSSNATSLGLTYLRKLSSENGISTMWLVDGRNFTLMGLDNDSLKNVEEQLTERGIKYTVVPATTDMDDMDDHGPQVQVAAVELKRAMNNAKSMSR